MLGRFLFGGGERLAPLSVALSLRLSPLAYRARVLLLARSRYPSGRFQLATWKLAADLHN